MSSRAKRYVTEALAHTGLAMLSSEVAATLRPDLWRDQRDCGGELHEERSRVWMKSLPGVRSVWVRRQVDDAPSVEVLCRSDARLLGRLHEVTGETWLAIALDDAERSTPWSKRVRLTQGNAASRHETDAAPQRTPRASAGDVHEGVHTARAGMTCSQCARLTAGHRCAARAESGLLEPHPNVPRRCVAFIASDEVAVLPRTGVELWPELQQ